MEISQFFWWWQQPVEEFISWVVYWWNCGICAVFEYISNGWTLWYQHNAQVNFIFFVLVLVRLKSCGALLFLYLNLPFNKCGFQRYILESIYFIESLLLMELLLLAKPESFYIYIWMLDFFKLVIGIRNYHMIEVILCRYLQICWQCLYNACILIAMFI